MASGLKALHDIDRAISKARGSVSKAAKLPSQASSALADVSRKQLKAYESIAKVRLEMIEDGEGDGALGYVDRQAVKLLTAHEKEEQRLIEKADASLDKITALETARRAQEKTVEKAVLAYDKGAEACQNKLVINPDYIALINEAEDAEATTERAIAKQELAEGEVEEKGAPYRSDPYFQYLQKRRYGTKQAKGWFLTKMFDGILARRGRYRDAALNYQRLTDIPLRLARHVENLEVKEQGAQLALKTAEEDALVKAGVTKLKEKSLSAQVKLDAIDARLEAAETEHQNLRAAQSSISAGDSAPYKEAIALLVNTLERKDGPSLRRLAAQTISRDDDLAVGDLIDLSRHARDLEEDQRESKKILGKYQKTLGELEALRRKFKNRRYDAPNSQFPGSFGGSLLGSLLGQLIGGMLSSNDLWRQIERAQRTVRRRSDVDFGGIDWSEAMRLPRNSGGFGGGIFGGSSGGRSSGGWGGSTRRAPRRRPRTRMPRAPRRRAPRARTPKRKSSGGFRTGGGF